MVEVRVPVLAESVAEATLMDWHKQPGDPVRFGDTLIDVETDKVTLEVVAPEDGTLVSILKNGGEDVGSNELIAQIDTEAQASVTETADNGAADAAEPEAPADETAAEATPQQAPEAPVDVTASEATPEPEPEAQPEAEPAGDTGRQAPLSDHVPKSSPAVRKLLAEHGLEAHEIPASGTRLTKKDVLDYLSDRENTGQDAQNGKPAAEAGSPAADDGETGKTEKADGGRAQVPETRARKTEQQAPAPAREQRKPEGGESPEGADNRVPMSRLRRRAAQRLLAAQRENAILTTFNEVNMKPVMDLRSRYKESFEKTHGIKLGFMSFFTKAAVEALKKFPVVNASVDGDDIIYHNYYDIGIAVSSPRGLVVPVIRAADKLSFAEIEKTISDYGQKARDAKLTLEELIGGTFTITNGGVFGSLLSTPILNPPQSAILGMHKIEERPVAENGEVVIRPMMYLALSYDHRIIDGREAVSFLVALREALEDPSRLLLQI